MSHNVIQSHTESVCHTESTDLTVLPEGEDIFLFRTKGLGHRGVV